MSRGPTTFRQRDVTAAIVAAEKSGTLIERVVLNRDGLVEITGRPAPPGYVRPPTAKPQRLAPKIEALPRCADLYEGPAVYFLEAPPMPAVKIGYVGNGLQVHKRIARLQTGCPHKLYLLVAARGSREWEAEAHAEFLPQRLTGEWFTLTPKLRKLICMLQAGMHMRTAMQKLRNG